MTTRFDAIVVGLGTMGSAACYHLADRGARVLGLERFAIPHGQGAGHGYSRVIRKAYFEHPDYVPLLERSYVLWDRLEAESGLKLLHRTGGLYLGRPDSEAIAGSLRAMRQFGLSHEPLSREEVERRYPQLRVPEEYVGLYEEATGFLVPERCVAAHCEQAMRRGAELHGHEPVLEWTADARGVSVRTHAATYHADRLVFCGGAWSGRLLARLGVELVVTRQVLGWLWPRRPELFALGRWPVWMIDTSVPGEPTAGQHYGFPMMADNPGFKVALHKPAEPTDPDRVARDPLPGDEETFRPVVRRFIPDADGPTLAIRVCLYTNSPDSHFILDRHPEHERVSIACGFSGHGFKFASAVGQAMAELALDGRSTLPIEFLGLRRFARPRPVSAP